MAKAVPQQTIAAAERDRDTSSDRPASPAGAASAASAPAMTADFVRLSPDECKTAARAMLRELDDLGQTPFADWPEREDLNLNQATSGRPVCEAERGQRLLDARNVLEDMEKSDLSDYTLIGTFAGGRPAGLMSLVRVDGFPPFIEIMVTHPQSRGYGKALIREASRISREWGGDGKLLLVPMHPHHRPIYEAMGLVPSTGQFLEYTPKAGDHAGAAPPGRSGAAAPQ